MQAALDAGAEVGHAGGVFSETALHIACARGNLPVVEVLAGNGADPNARCERNNTPLHEAAFANQAGCVRWMLANTAVRIGARNANGRTAHGIARGQRHTKLAATLQREMDRRAKALEERRSQRRERKREEEASRSPERTPTTTPAFDTTHAEKVGVWYAATLAALNTQHNPNGATWSDLAEHTSLLRGLLDPLQAACTKACDSGNAGLPVTPATLLPHLVAGLPADKAEGYVSRMGVVMEGSMTPMRDVGEGDGVEVSPEVGGEETVPEVEDVVEAVVGSPPETKEVVEMVPPQAEVVSAPEAVVEAEKAVAVAVTTAVEAVVAPMPAAVPVVVAPVEPVVQPVAAAAAAAGASDGPDWMCDLCCFDNPGHLNACEQCDEPK